MQRRLIPLLNLTKNPDRRPQSAPGRGAGKRATILLGAICIGTFATPAMAEREPKTKLVRCGEQSCLQISGRRDDPAAIVKLNGHRVAAEGRKGWRVRLPVETVRQWSTPHARTIEVSLHHPEMERVTSISADLPIGLLGNVTNLAFLEISAR